MCQFISWVEKDGGIFFLTGKQIYHTKRGRELRKYNPAREDWIGHGAIRWFYEFEGGKDRECIDYSTPHNFPPIISDAIKNGEMRGLRTPKKLLNESAWAEYEKIEQSAWAECEKIGQSAWAEYEKIGQSARAEYEKIGQSAFWDFFANSKNRNPLWR